ncbi:MAG: hypothetical protein KatS3mg003_1822 [Candidatus Nitrosocaldaceae archaeon]|nr:MAG: hypothetical protein KatS3mg003_1822 [Candidatus Nitrosocaldaceae archaeon]
MMSNAECISKDMLIKEIKEHISSIVGYGTLDILDTYLAMNNASLDEIFDKPEEVSKGLDTIFGSGAAIIKKELISILSTKFKIKGNNLEVVIDNIKELIKD